MSITCEKCGGKTSVNGYGDCETYIRKRTCLTCHHVMYTKEEQIDADKGYALWSDFRYQLYQADSENKRGRYGRNDLYKRG